MPRESRQGESSSTFSMSQRELLIRIDERVKSMEMQLSALKLNIITPEEKHSILREVEQNKQAITELMNFKTRIVAYLAAAGAVGGVVVAFISDYIKQSIFR